MCGTDLFGTGGVRGQRPLPCSQDGLHPADCKRGCVSTPSHPSALSLSLPLSQTHTSDHKLKRERVTDV